MEEEGKGEEKKRRRRMERKIKRRGRVGKKKDDEDERYKRMEEGEGRTRKWVMRIVRMIITIIMTRLVVVRMGIYMCKRR